ncbi:hypothetical protein Asppvi_000134 [Aspergillus pseudoviridinutans]|uniref:Uncharacterized protein n=1 Tax=Aspergillus pseudoviridinutans TaxID=1517512 RepID=A0A9P3B203_9EURO|nr:uncharacterized protein Asppvi_000134 [Aspergillus pseudoviridinutans]GIJ81635.1 hypothetical protein Asppvi_000134 [Aspergillus pseudoviridinutans]
MTLSPEAIIAMVALFVACIPYLKSIIFYYLMKVRQQQNGIQQIGLSQLERPNFVIHTSVVLLGLNSSHDSGDETHTRHIVPERYQIDAVLNSPSPSGSESMGSPSHRARHIPPPFYLLGRLCTLLREHDIAILLSRVGATVLLIRRAAISDEENQHLAGPEANIIDLDEDDQLG